MALFDYYSRMGDSKLAENYEMYQAVEKHVIEDGVNNLITHLDGLNTNLSQQDTEGNPLFAPVPPALPTPFPSFLSGDNLSPYGRVAGDRQYKPAALNQPAKREIRDIAGCELDCQRAERAVASEPDLQRPPHSKSAN